MALVISLCLFFLCSLYFIRSGLTKTGRNIFSAVVFLYLFLWVFYLIVDSLSGKGINDAVLYHLYADLAGTGWSDFMGTIVSGVLAILLCAAVSFGVVWSVKISRGNYASFGVFILLFVAVLSHPTITQSYNLFQSQMQGITKGDEEFFRHFVQPSMLPLSEKPKNLIYIYAESLERSYFDAQVFPGLLSNLSEWEARATSFTNIHNLAGTEWTIAGMTASQCGIPLVTPSMDGNGMAGYDRFLSRAHCLGDLLAKQDYRLSFLGGASLEFSGKGQFYRSHGFQDVQGLDEMKHLLPDPDYQSSWGLYDDFLLDQVLSEARSLSQGNEPYGLFALTLDTHHPDGHLSSACEGVVYADGANDMLNAVKCADLLLARLLDALDADGLMENTLVVVASDHFAMPNGAEALLNSVDRRNLLMLIDSDDPKIKTIDTPGTTLDVAPVVLSRLGFPVKAFALGRNIEQVDSLYSEIPAFEQWLLKRSSVFRGFWELPDALVKAPYSEGGQALEIGGQQIRFPVVLSMDSKYRVTAMDFLSADESVPGLKNEVYQLIVDRCSQFIDRLEGTPFEDIHGLCFLFSAINDTSYIAIEEKLIENVWSAEILEAIHQGQTPYALPVRKVWFKPGFRIFSVGGINGQSAFISPEGRTPFARGLTVFGMSEGVVTQLVTIDLCSNPDQKIDGYFQQLQLLHRDRFDYIGVNVHDTAYCSGAGVAAFFRSSPLSHGGTIGFRTPYIGLVDRSGAVIAEKTGETGGQVIIWAEELAAEATVSAGSR